jgi:hypothetical protein
MREDGPPLFTSSDLPSSAATPFVVTETLSKVYYRGLPSKPPLIATTKPDPFKDPNGPEAYSVLKELRELGDHPLSSAWDHSLADDIRRGLNTMCVNWTSIEALRIVEVGESSGPAIVWIGVEFGALSFEEGSVVALKCRTFIERHGIPDCHVETRESRILRQAAYRFLDPVPLSDPTFTARDPYTATLGIPISTKNRPWAEGTGGFYMSAGGHDEGIYLVTARHVVLPNDEDENKEYKRENDSHAREDVVVLGTPSFNDKLAAIDDEIRGQESAIIDAEERIKLANGEDDPGLVREREKAERDLHEAHEALKALRTLRLEISDNWEAKENRVFGELAWAPPITLSTEPDQYTLDLAVIKIDEGKLDAKNYRGNSINIGNKYTRKEFMDKVNLNHTNTTSFKFPANRLVMLRDQVLESALVKPVPDTNGCPCLVVFKNGAKTGTTIGKANNVSSFTRNYFAGRYQESREWPVISIDKHSGGFSKNGDSGSCVVDAFRRVGGIVTGGSGAIDCCDVTYVTPISFIMKVLHSTKPFEHAHLNPVLT